MADETYSAAGIICPHCEHLHRKWSERPHDESWMACESCGKDFRWWATVYVSYYADKSMEGRDDDEEPEDGKEEG